MKTQDTGSSQSARSYRIFANLISMTLLLVLISAGSTQGALPAINVTTECSDLIVSQGPVQLITRVDRTSAQVAEEIKLTLEVVAPQGVRVSLPTVAEPLGNFEIRKVEELLDIPVVDGRKSTRTYMLESLVPGQYTIPAIGVTYVDTRHGNPSQQTANSKPVPISIVSLLEGQTDPSKFRDIKGIVDITPPVNRRRFLLFAVATATTLIGAGVAFTFYLRRDRELSAQQWALADLDRLEAKRMMDELSAPEFYTLVTDIVRSFIERRFDIAAPRLTSTEFFSRIERHHQLTAYLKPLRTFLATADMVKFAGLEPQDSDCSAAVRKAREFVEASTTPRLKENA